MDPKISFISDKNLKRVYTAISNSVKENYNYNINNEFFIEMKGMMEFILQNVPRYNPQKQTPRQYLKFLNTKLLVVNKRDSNKCHLACVFIKLQPLCLFFFLLISCLDLFFSLRYGCR